MSLHLLLAATEVSMPEKFGLEVTAVVLQIISFLILAGVLYWFAIRPVLATMEQRAQKIDAGLKYSEEMKAKLDAAQQESLAISKRAQAEATRVIDEARKTAKELLDRQTQETAARAAEILTKAQQVIEQEKKKMLAEARTEIARLVVATTQQVLGSQLSDADRARYNESAARELAKV